MKNHFQFYSYAEAYDIAFDFKDIKAECEFLRSVFEFYNKKPPKSFLDLGAGPALHAIEMAKCGVASTAIDLSKDMVEYGLQKANKSGVKIKYYVHDMSSFELNQKFDMVGIFMDSTSYLLTNESFTKHLRSVSGVLNTKGIYILEMSHPRDVFSAGTSTTNSWEVERDGVWVSVEWGNNEDFFDPISQITETSVRLKIRKNGKEDEINDTAPQRCFTVNEFKALVQAEGSFEILDFYGDLKANIAFSNEKKSWRMIPVLRKK